MKKINTHPIVRERKQLLPVVLLLTMPLLQPITLNAQSALESCAEIENSDQRLACYDRAVERSPSSDLPEIQLPRTRGENIRQSVVNQEPVATTPEASPQPETAGNASDSFGLDLNKMPKEESVRTFTVLTASHNDFTGWTIEFDNGQVWRQIGTDDYRIRTGEQYTINKAFMNSYLLSNASNNRKIRISRIK